ncbi:MAG: hypothetical protein AAGF71_09155 [Pseudomonadota bacterium]
MASLQLRRVAHGLRAITVLTMLLVPLAIVLWLITQPLSGHMLQAVFPRIAVPAQLELWQIWGAYALSVGPLGVFLIMLWRLQVLLRVYAAGEALSDRAVGLIRGLGNCLIALVLVGVITRAGQSVVLSWTNPPGERALAIGLGSQDIILLLMGGLLVLIGSALADGVRAVEENRGFI